jgi:rhamnulokinase
MNYLACDLGAESGRLILGTLTGQKLVLEELHRFANVPIKAEGSLHWDIPKLFSELKDGLRKAGARKIPVAGISTDSWGVDYLLFDGEGQVIGPTFHYRDPRTKRGVENAFAKVNWETIFGETGIQFMVLNTIYQLAAEEQARLGRSKLLLGIGDGFNYLLSGKAVIEESMASTFQLYNPRSKNWSDRLIKALGLPREIFPPIVSSGTTLGPLRAEMAAETGLRGVDVVASCSHDTGAAVAGVPAAGENWGYLSSGTWSLMGVELREAIINDEARELNFTNEIGFGGSVRLLKNIIGLWIVQECRRHWTSEGVGHDYKELTRMAAQAEPFVSLINPADPRYLAPGDMPARIAAFCRETNQPAPRDCGATIRCVLESLALLYRRTLLQIQQLIGKNIERLHIVGGGCQNELLNQFAANATQVPVVAGPVEATAAGNVLIQSIALGHLPSLAAARTVVRESFQVQTIAPADAGAWLAAFQRFEKIAGPAAPPEK